MDLRTWVAADHSSLQRRFDSSIASVVPVERWTEQADGGGSSIAWLLLHSAYHADLALTTAVRDHAPLIASHRHELGLEGADPSAGLGEAQHDEVVGALDLAALERYARTVHEAIQRWIEGMSIMALDTIPDSGERLRRRAAVTREAAAWLHALWNDKPVWWLVQWECIGHRHAHLGEMISVRNRLGLSRF